MSYNTNVHLGSEVAHSCYNRGVRKSETALVLETPNAASDHYSRERTAMATSDSTTNPRIPNLPHKKYSDAVKQKAVNAVNSAVSCKRMAHISTQLCIVCNAPAQSYHHESYEKADWLKVVPMCFSCHHMLHVYGSDNLASTIADHLFARIDTLRKPLRRWKAVPLSDDAAAELTDLEARYEYICEAFNV